MSATTHASQPHVHAYAAHDARMPLEAFQYEPPPLAAMDVEIAITHCGICHTDLHLIDNDFGITPYPLVPGHEIVGTISAIGAEVDLLQVGQRVGVGWQAGSCLGCEWCVGGDENLCVQAQPTCVGRPGGYANRIRLHSHFAFPIPDALESVHAAPLLCGGATVFSPLLNYNVGAHTRLGVVSIGGLGHLALQFGHAFGCPVTAFSTSPGKEEEARKFGADTFVNLHDAEAMQAQATSLDLIIATAPSDLPWDTLLSTLRPKGVLCIVGVPPSPVQVAFFPLILGDRKIVGSNTGSRAGITKMLDFAAQHGVQPQIERFPMSQVNQALDRLRSGQVRYRIVLEN
jgi:uncharacterized zinc-type alcohol dehydrogenase-like protein